MDLVVIVDILFFSTYILLLLFSFLMMFNHILLCRRINF